MPEALVLLPGMMCDARLFERQITALSQDHAVMVAPVTQGERIEEIASLLLDQLPMRFALAGLSLGGIVAMEILRRAPDRVSRLCLMDTNPLAETPAIAATREPMIVGARADKLSDVLGQAILPEHLATGPNRRAVMGQLHQMGMDLGAEVFVRQSRALQRRRDQQSTLRKCAVPTLILCGAEDTLTPVKRHEFMAELIRGAQLCVIDGAGHIPTLEQPDAVTEALRRWMKQPFVLT